MAATSNLTLLMKVFEQEKALFWMNNPGLPEEELQRKWAAQTGKFHSILGTPTPDETIPRYPLSSSSAPRMKREQSDNLASQNADQAQHSSQPHAPMSRKRTNDSHKGPSPSSSTGNTVPPLTLHSFHTDNNEPFSNYTIKARRTSNGRMPIHIPVTEYNDPKEFYSTLESNPSPIAPHTQHYSPLGTSPTFSHSPSTPITTHSTNPTILTSTGMSRPDSQMGNTVCEGLNMLRLKSQASNASSGFESTPHDSQASTVKYHTDDASPVFNNTHLLDFTGGVVPEVSQQSLLVSSMSSSQSSSSPLPNGLQIQRTSSSDSHPLSLSRVSSRGQNSTQALQLLAPKVEPIAPSMSRSISSEHRMIRVKSADGSVKDKISITKAPYVRPQQPKIACPHCDSKPDGYRGEHELGRHINKAHSLTRTVWVCIDISPDKSFLSKCKQCIRGKKYNAYYNAAAHLRRAHFNPRPKGRKGKSNEEETTKRAGSSGGELPPMDYCKLWMREIREDVLQNASPYDDEEEDDDETPTNAAGTHAAQPDFQTSLSLPFELHHSNAQSIPIPHPATVSGQMMYPPTLSLSAPATRLADDNSLYLSQPSQTSAISDKADILDLSLDTSVNAELPFQMSPFVENPDLFDGFSNAKF
ncbi:MAG: hypothetical protein LQ343_000097 [Gyalolechia ehrenbergii]|nr:MAG: hypothetical protein LQ343_000097 [Gyalolechia ehrenbergii]